MDGFDNLIFDMLGHGIMLTNNEIKVIMKVNKSLENLRILLEVIIEKVANEEGGSLSNGLGPLMKVGLPLMKNILGPLAKSVLKPLGLMAAASATDAATQRKIYGSGMTTLIISKEE